MNVIALTGRLTGDAQVRYFTTDNGEQRAIARFSIAVQRSKDKADFFNCVAYKKEAEFIEKYGKKGVKFEVSGRLITSSYTNKEGVKINSVEVEAQHIGFSESKKDDQPAPVQIEWLEESEFPFN